MQDSSEARAVLGLPLDATRDEAQRAFRRLAKQTHPDAGGNAASFLAVASAWAELGEARAGGRTGPRPSGWCGPSPGRRPWPVVFLQRRAAKGGMTLQRKPGDPPSPRSSRRRWIGWLPRSLLSNPGSSARDFVARG